MTENEGRLPTSASIGCKSAVQQLKIEPAIKNIFLHSPSTRKGCQEASLGSKLCLPLLLWFRNLSGPL